MSALVQSSERVAAVFEGAGDFGEAIGAGRDFVFEFDSALDGPFVVADQLEDFLEGGVAFAEGEVWAVILFTVLQMDVRNARVMLFDERDGGGVVAGDEVAEIDVGAVELREGKGFLPMFGRGGGMAVVADHQLMFVGEFSDAFVVVVFLGNFRGNGASAEGFGEVENVFEFGVAHFEDAVHFDNFDEHAGVFVFFAELFDAIHGNGFAPFGEIFCVCGSAAGGDGVPWADQGFRGAEETFDGLGAKFDAADAELNAGFEDVVAGHQRVSKAVGNVDAKLDAVDFGVWFVGGETSRHRKHAGAGDGKFGKLAAGKRFHVRSV